MLRLRFRESVSQKCGGGAREDTDGKHFSRYRSAHLVVKTVKNAAIESTVH